MSFYYESPKYEKVIENKKFTPFWCKHCEQFKKENIDTGLLNNLFQKVHDYSKKQTLESLSFDVINKMINKSKLTMMHSVKVHDETSRPDTNVFYFSLGGSMECNNDENCAFLGKVLNKTSLEIMLRVIALYTILYEAEYVPNTATIKPFTKCHISYSFSRLGYRFEPIDYKFNSFINSYRQIKLGEDTKYEDFTENYKYKKLWKHRNKFKVLEQTYHFDDGSN